VAHPELGQPTAGIQGSRRIWTTSVCNGIILSSRDRGKYLNTHRISKNMANSDGVKDSSDIKLSIASSGTTTLEEKPLNSSESATTPSADQLLIDAPRLKGRHTKFVAVIVHSCERLDN